MPKLRQAQTNFTAGQLDATLAARADTAIFQNGAETLKNGIILWSGGFRTRPATTYCAALNTNPSKLAPWVFDENESYVVAFSNGRVDFYDDTGTLVDTLTSCPWTAAMLPALNWEQYGDTMFVFHEDLQTQVLTRTAADTFARAAYAFETNAADTVTYQPYYKFADTAMTLATSGTSGSVTVTLSGAGAFTSDHIGFIVRRAEEEILITAVASATSATGTCRQTLTASSATTDWDEAVFSDARGYARSGAFFNDRLILCGSRSRRSGIWGSKIGAYYNFDLGSADPNEAFWENWPGARVSDIKHCLAAEHLIVWSDRAFAFVPSSESAGLTPENFRIREQEPYGANNARPQPFDGAALYVQNSSAAVREALWQDSQQRYSGGAVNKLAKDIISNPSEMAVLYGEENQPESYAFLVNDDGTIAFFMSEREEKIAAWLPWTTEGTFESVCVILDKVFVAVERTLNSTTVLALELFDRDRAPLDCAKRVTSGSPTRSFSGFTHLANETVKVVTKGHYLGEYTVSAGGVITLDASDPEVTEIEAGFSFPQQITPMPVDIDLQDGKSRGLMKRLIRALITVDQSAQFTIQGRDVFLTFQGDDYDTAPTPNTGVLEVRLLGIDRSAQFDLIVNDPVKVTVLGITREVEING